MGKINDMLLAMDLNEIRDKLLGQDVRFIDNLHEGYYDALYVNRHMADTFSGGVANIRNIDNSYGNIIFQIQRDSCWFTFDIVSEILDVQGRFKPVIDSIEEQNINMGALVRVKNIENKKEKKLITTFCGLNVYNGYSNTKIKKRLENKVMIVCDIKDNKILPYWMNKNYISEPITTDMVEVIDNDYLKNIKEKTTKLTKKEEQILDDLKTMEEMKSKVDVKKFKKIYASAMEKIPKDLKGIDLILHQWAFNKKHLYKMLGNKFSIFKEIEYDRSSSEITQDRVNLYREFPGIYPIVDNEIYDSEIANNKLEHDILGNSFQTYCRSFKKGEKVSKVLDELYHSKDLNMRFSDIVAKTKIKGFIEISIDPIDILLMSCNMSGWTSCHTIAKPGYDGRTYGCYSAGIFSYMCDSSSMIAFRHDGKEYDYKINKNTIKAKSKNWRQMIWIKEDFKAFITSRQYPKYMDQVAKEIRELLEEQINSYIEENIWVHTSKKENIKKYISNKREGYGSNLHYNDVKYNYDCDMCYHKESKLVHNFIKVGSYPVCPICGDNVITEASSPKCNKCR